jgi:cytochrome c553
MKASGLLQLAVVVGLAAGCANLQRSRDTGDHEVSGKTLALQVCSNCHGATGNSTSPNFPNLARQQEQYLSAQLADFRGHTREDPAGFEYMWGLSHHLTDDQIDGLAKYFAAQPLQPLRVRQDQQRVAAGMAIFSDGVPEKGIPACHSCHGSEGQGNGTFPRIAGQHADYLVKQLDVFQRTNQRPEGSIMKTVAHSLTRENIEDVAAYLQTVPVK